MHRPLIVPVSVLLYCKSFNFFNSPALYVFVNIMLLSIMVHSQDHMSITLIYACIDAPGVVLLLFSLVLTRGIDVVRKEFSAPTGLASLIGDDACCEQVS
jgi:hypothetical protein